jgi:hypothetical protein
MKLNTTEKLTSKFFNWVWETYGVQKDSIIRRATSGRASLFVEGIVADTAVMMDATLTEDKNGLFVVTKFPENWVETFRVYDNLVLTRVTNHEITTATEEIYRVYDEVKRINNMSWWGKEETGKNYIQSETSLSDDDIEHGHLVCGVGMYDASYEIFTELGIMKDDKIFPLCIGELAINSDIIKKFVSGSIVSKLVDFDTTSSAIKWLDVENRLSIINS